MINCRACHIFHDPRMNCGVARKQLDVGTLQEPWLSANRLGELVEKKHGKICPEPVVRTVPKAAPQVGFEVRPKVVPESHLEDNKPLPAVAAPCPVCEAKKKKEAEYMRKYRKKALVTNSQK